LRERERVGVTVRVRALVPVAVTEAEARFECVDVRVALRDTTVREAVAVMDDRLDRLTREIVAVAVLEALAPYVRLLVGVYDGCGQKQIGSFA